MQSVYYKKVFYCYVNVPSNQNIHCAMLLVQVTVYHLLRILIFFLSDFELDLQFCVNKCVFHNFLMRSISQNDLPMADKYLPS